MWSNGRGASGGLLAAAAPPPVPASRLEVRTVTASALSGIIVSRSLEDDLAVEDRHVDSDIRDRDGVDREDVVRQHHHVRQLAASERALEMLFARGVGAAVSVGVDSLRDADPLLGHPPL